MSDTKADITPLTNAPIGTDGDRMSAEELEQRLELTIAGFYCEVYSGNCATYDSSCGVFTGDCGVFTGDCDSYGPPIPP